MKKSFTILSIPAFILLFTGMLIASGGGGDKHGSRSGIYSGITLLGNPTTLQVNPLALIFQDDMDGTNDTTALKARGYKVYYRGTGPQGTAAIWFQGNPASFPAYSGPTNGYVGSNFNSVTGTNTIDNWLVLPALDIATGDTLSFYAQSVVSSFVDSIRVMYSSAGDTVPEATTWIELGSFEVNKGAWQLYEFIAGSSGTDARFAIRYRVADAGPLGNNSDYIGIDEIMVRGTPPVVCPVTTVPVTTSGSNCGAGTVSLSATTGGTNTYVVWMDSLGNVVGSGNNFNPSLSTTTTFYAADADTVGFSANVGPDTSIATGPFPGGNFTNGLYFTALTDIRIDSVHLYSNGAVSGNFQISDSAGGAVQQTAPFSLSSAGYHQVYVGLNVSAGDYFINMGNFTGTGILFRTTGGATYPYTVPGLVSITGANFPSSPTRYYYFFEWTVTPVCFGTQVAATAAILPANNTLPFFEDFENGLPCNWSTTQDTSSTGWLWGDSASLSSQFWTIPGHSNFMASNDDACNCDMSMDYLISPVFDFSSYTSLTNITLNFEAYYDSLYGSSAYVEVSLDSGMTWNIVHTLSPVGTWQNVIVDLSAYAGNPAVQIAFHHDDNMNWADGFAVDDVLITAVCSGEELTVNLLTDIFGSEISWSIVDINTSITYGTAGPFPDVTPYSVAAATHNMTVCVPLGATLEWRIEDSFGDGLLDGTNTGNYSLIGPCGQLITSGSGAFTSGGSTANPPQYDSLVFTVQPPAINLGADTILCEGTTLTLNAGLPNVTWSNGQTTQSIVINNDTPGTYAYFVSTPAGNCFATDTITVTVNPLPVPDFSATSILGLATFSNSTANGVTYHWNFGTGNAADTSNLANPTFTYTANGTYTVVLTATNPCGSVSHTFDITITGIVGITEIPGATINISPNPAADFMIIDISGLSGEKITVNITNVLGQQIYSDLLTLTGDNYSSKIDVSSYDKGVYFITIQTEKHATTRKLIIE
ncbi:MAG: choice-of-anchor J domain-containing protein [Bacteroidia bacterium]